MAFLQENFAPVGGRGADVPGFWTYKTTTDSQTAIQAAGYFIDKQHEMVFGDLIWAAALDGTVLLHYRGPLVVPVQVAPSSGGGGPVTAIEVSYNNVASGLTADNVQLALDEIDANVDANVLDIAANVADILTNSGLIATNTADISTNAGDILTNAGDIATNVLDIATNAGDILTNTGLISTNTTNIATNTGDIATNAINIAANSSAIGAIDTPTAAEVPYDPIASGMTATNVQAALEENHALIDINAADILTNTGDIGTNASAISLNTMNIDLNTTAIQTLTAGQVAFDPSPSDLLSTDCQAAIEEVNAKTGGGGGGSSIVQSLKNKFLNGDFSQWQRGLSLISGIGIRYLADRWLIGNVLGSYSAAQIAGQVHDFALRVTSTATGGIAIDQRVEASVFPAGQVCTVTAKVLIPVTVLNCSISIYKDTAGLIDQVPFVATGSLQTVVATLTSNGTAITAYSFEIFGDTPINDFIEVHEVQVEYGSESTEFDKRLPAQEQTLCLPYFERQFFPVANFNISILQAVTAVQCHGFLGYSPKQALPVVTPNGSFTCTSAAGVPTACTIIPLAVALHGASFRADASGLVAGNATILQGGAGSFIDIDAEL